MTDSTQLPVQRAIAGAWRADLLIVCVAGLLCYTHLDSPLLEPEETRYAEIPRQMLEEGRWAIPVVHGQPYYDKPPLLYWLVMVNYQCLGVYDWSARLISCTASFLCILVAYFWCKKVASARSALLAALMLALSARFIHLGRMLTMNSLLSLSVLGSIAFIYHAIQGPTLCRRAWFGAAIFCGIGLLTKGPVALVLVLVPAAAYSRFCDNGVCVRLRHHVGFVVISVSVAAPWFVAVCLTDPSFAEYFFWTHHVLRYVAPLDHEQPFWYYVPQLLLGMFPWTLLAPGLICDLIQRWRRREALDLMGFLFLSAVWCVLFHSAAGCKRNGYILPAFPLLAMALGLHFDAMLRAGLLPKRVSVPFVATVCVLCAGLAGATLAATTGLVGGALGALLAAASGLGILTTAIVGRAKRLPWHVPFVATFVVLFVAVVVLLPRYNQRYSWRDPLTRLAADARLAGVPIICYPQRWDSVSYYLRRNDLQVFRTEDLGRLPQIAAHQPQALFFVKKGRALGDFMTALPHALVFEPCLQKNSVIAGRIIPRAARSP